MQEKASPIDGFLMADRFAVAGASDDRNKYGNKVFIALNQLGRPVYPLNPTATEIEGCQAFADLKSLPHPVQALSLVTPPQVTRSIVQAAVEQLNDAAETTVNGLKYIWMQPGAQDAQASQLARQAGLTVIDDGSCILVALASVV